MSEGQSRATAGARGNAPEEDGAADPTGTGASATDAGASVRSGGEGAPEAHAEIPPASAARPAATLTVIRTEGAYERRLRSVIASPALP